MSDTNTPDSDANSPPQSAGGDGYADGDALTVTRDGEGELLPQDTDTELYGKVRAVPLTYGDVEAYFGDAEVADIDSEMIATLLAEHIVRPDLGAVARQAGYEGVTAAWVREELKPLAPRDLILAVLSVSDIDADVAMQGQGEAQVAFETGN